MSLVLLEHPDSPNCRKVRLLLAALRLPYASRRVELLHGETRGAEFLAINPSGQIPVLIHAGLVLPESNAILLHLAARFAPAWLGRDEARRAQVNRFLFWQCSGVTRRVAAVGQQRVVNALRGRAPDLSIVAAETAQFRRESVVLEGWLREHAFVADDLSVADIALGAWLELACHLGMLRDMPATRGWLARLTALEFWVRAGGYELLARVPEAIDPVITDEKGTP